MRQLTLRAARLGSWREQQSLALTVQRQLQQRHCKGDGENATPALCTQAPQAVARRAAGAPPHVRVRVGGRTGLPRATSGRLPRPSATRRHRRAPSSSGYVWRRLRWAAWSKARAGRVSAPARGSPVLILIGLDFFILLKDFNNMNEVFIPSNKIGITFNGIRIKIIVFLLELSSTPITID